jgi:hypothetical protein
VVGLKASNAIVALADFYAALLADQLDAAKGREDALRARLAAAEAALLGQARPDPGAGATTGRPLGEAVAAEGRR